MGIFVILLIACGIHGIGYGLYCIVMTAVFGIRLLAAEKGTEVYDNRKSDFKRVLKGLLIFFCVIACCAVLVFVLGSLIVANM